MKRTTLFAILLISVFRPGFGQLLESDTARWQARLSASLFLNQGNVERLLWRNNAVIKHVAKGWGFSSRQTYIRGTFGAFKTENDWFSANFLYYRPRLRWYPYLMGWTETNLRRQIGFRYQLGPGLSYRILQSERHLAKISLTGTFEHTAYQGSSFSEPPEGLDGRVLALYRLTARLWAQHRLSDKLLLQYEYWWQQGLRQAENRRWYLEGQLQAGLGKGLSLLGNLQYSYEPFVPTGVRKRDLLLTFGIQLQFLKM